MADQGMTTIQANLEMVGRWVDQGLTAGVNSAEQSFARMARRVTETYNISNKVSQQTAAAWNTSAVAAQSWAQRVVVSTTQALAAVQRYSAGANSALNVLSGTSLVGTGDMTSMAAVWTGRLIGIQQFLVHARALAKDLGALDLLQASYARIVGASAGTGAATGMASRAMQEATAIAWKYGASIQDVMGTMVELARLGRSTSEVRYLTQSLGELRLLLASGTGELLTMGEAMNSVVTMMNQFDASVFDAMDGLKLMAEYDIRTATSFNAIQTAMNRFAGAAKNANMSLTETIQVATAATETGITGARAGTMLNSVLARVASNKDAIAMMDRLGVSTVTVKDGMLTAASSMDRLLEAYRKLINGGATTRELAQFAQAMAGLRLQSTFMSTMRIYDRQTRLQVDDVGFEQATNALQADLQKAIRVLPPVTIPIIRGGVELDQDEIAAQLRKGVDKLVSRLRADFKSTGRINFGESLDTYVSRWLQVDIDRAKKLIDQYKDVFSEVQNIMDEYSNTVESPYARMARDARAFTDKLKAERQKAVNDMSSTMEVAMSRLKTVWQATFLNSEFVAMFKSGVEEATTMLAILGRGVMTTIQQALTAFGLAELTTGIRTIGTMLTVYFGARTATMLGSIFSGAIQSAGVMLDRTILLGETLTRIWRPGPFRSYMTDTAEFFTKLDLQMARVKTASDEASRQLTSLYAGVGNAQPVPSNFPPRLGNVGQAGTLRTQLRSSVLIDWQAQGRGMGEFQRNWSSFSQRLGKDMSTLGYDAVNLWRSLDRIAKLPPPSGTGKVSWAQFVSGLRTAARDMTGEIPQLYSAMLGKLPNMSGEIEKNMLRLKRIISAPITTADVRASAQEIYSTYANMTGRVSNLFATMQAMMAKGMTPKSNPKEFADLQRVIQNIIASMSGLDKATNNVAATTSRWRTALATGMQTLSSVVGGVFTVIAAVNLAFQGLRWVRGFFSNTTEEIEKMNDALETSSERVTALQKAVEDLRKTQENTNQGISALQDEIQNKVLGNVYAYDTTLQIATRVTGGDVNDITRDINEVVGSYAERIADLTNKALEANKNDPTLAPMTAVELSSLIPSLSDLIMDKLRIPEADRARFAAALSDDFKRLGIIIEDRVRALAEQERRLITEELPAARRRLEGAETAVVDAQTAAATSLKTLWDNTIGDVTIDQYIPGGDVYHYENPEFTAAKERFAATAANMADFQKWAKYIEETTGTIVTYEALTGEHVGKFIDALTANPIIDEATGERLFKNPAQTLEEIRDVIGKSEALKGFIDKRTSPELQPYKDTSASLEKLATVLADEAEAKKNLEELTKDLGITVGEGEVPTGAELVGVQIELEAKIKEYDREIASLRKTIAAKRSAGGRQADVAKENAEIERLTEEQNKAAAALLQTQIVAMAGAGSEGLGKSFWGAMEEALTAAYKDTEVDINDVKKVVMEHSSRLFQTLVELRMAEAKLSEALTPEQKAQAEKELGVIRTRFADQLDTMIGETNKLGVELRTFVDSALDKILPGISIDYIRDLAKPLTGFVSRLFTSAISYLTAGQREELRKQQNKIDADADLKAPPTTSTSGADPVRALLTELKNTHQERMADIERAFLTIKDSEGNIIEYLDRTDTIDYIEAKITANINLLNEYSKHLREAKDPKLVAQIKKEVAQVQTEIAKMNLEIKVRFREAGVDEMRHQIDLLESQASRMEDIGHIAKTRALYEEIHARQMEMYDERMAQENDIFKRRDVEREKEKSQLDHQNKLAKLLTEEYERGMKIRTRESPIEDFRRTMARDMASMGSSFGSDVQARIKLIESEYERDLAKWRRETEIEGAMLREKKAADDKLMAEQRRNADAFSQAVAEEKRAAEEQRVASAEQLKAAAMHIALAGITAPKTDTKVDTEADKVSAENARTSATDVETAKTNKASSSTLWDTAVSMGESIKQRFQPATDKITEGVKKFGEWVTAFGDSVKVFIDPDAKKKEDTQDTQTVPPQGVTGGQQPQMQAQAQMPAQGGYPGGGYPGPYPGGYPSGGYPGGGYPQQGQGQGWASSSQLPQELQATGKAVEESTNKLVERLDEIMMSDQQPYKEKFGQDTTVRLLKPEIATAFEEFMAASEATVKAGFEMMGTAMPEPPSTDDAAGYDRYMKASMEALTTVKTRAEQGDAEAKKLMDTLQTTMDRALSAAGANDPQVQALTKEIGDLSTEIKNSGGQPPDISAIARQNPLMMPHLKPEERIGIHRQNAEAIASTMASGAGGSLDAMRYSADSATESLDKLDAGLKDVGTTTSDFEKEMDGVLKEASEWKVPEIDMTTAQASLFGGSALERAKQKDMTTTPVTRGSGRGLGEFWDGLKKSFGWGDTDAQTDATKELTAAVKEQTGATKGQTDATTSQITATKGQTDATTSQTGAINSQAFTGGTPPVASSGQTEATNALTDATRAQTEAVKSQTAATDEQIANDKNLASVQQDAQIRAEEAGKRLGVDIYAKAGAAGQDAAKEIAGAYANGMGDGIASGDVVPPDLAHKAETVGAQMGQSYSDIYDDALNKGLSDYIKKYNTPIDKDDIALAPDRSAESKEGWVTQWLSSEDEASASAYRKAHGIGLDSAGNLSGAFIDGLREGAGTEDSVDSSVHNAAVLVGKDVATAGTTQGVNGIVDGLTQGTAELPTTEPIYNKGVTTGQEIANVGGQQAMDGMVNGLGSSSSVPMGQDIYGRASAMGGDMAQQAQTGMANGMTSGMQGGFDQSALQSQAAATATPQVQGMQDSIFDGYRDALANVDDNFTTGRAVFDKETGEYIKPTSKNISDYLNRMEERVANDVAAETERLRAAGFEGAQLEAKTEEFRQKAEEKVKAIAEELWAAYKKFYDAIKSAIESGWDEGFNIGIEYGFTKEGVQELRKALKMQLAKAVNNFIKEAVVGPLTKMLTDAFANMGPMIGGFLGPLIGGFVGTIMGFLIGGLFSDFVNEQAEAQLKQQRDSVDAQGFSWNYGGEDKAEPYYQFAPDVTKESVNIINFRTTFNITTDAAQALMAQRRELERVCTEIFNSMTRAASSTFGPKSAV